MPLVNELGFFGSLIYSFTIYALNTYYVPRVVGDEYIALNKINALL